LACKLEIKNLKKNFLQESGDLLAVENASFRVREYEFLSIVGSSGCGKSTILNMIDGLIKPTSGVILIDGEDIQKTKRARNKRLIGYVFQQPRLLPWKTVRGNLEFVLDAQKIPKEEQEVLIKKYVRMVGLEGFENSYPSQLSGGMQGRLAIVRALCVDPEIILMDEPFSHLDEITARTLREELITLWQKAKKTVVFVTHDVKEAVFLSNRIVMLTPRPCKVHASIPIELSFPRDYDGEELLRVVRDVMSRFGELMIAE